MHLVLIDGSGFIFRAYHALPPMTRPDGTPVNAVFGFSNMLAKLLREHVGTHIAVIFDAGRKTFRNRLYEDYKAHRPPPPDDLIPQFNLVRQATEAFGVPAVELEDWEADDLIAAYAKAVNDAGGQATLVSSDKDLMQLIRPGVEMLDPIKQKPIGPAEVMEKYGVTPDKMIDVQALIGDPTDNVPGVPGIGPKGAAQLINEFGDLDSVLAAAPAMKPSKRRDNLIEHAEKARISRDLVTLRSDTPLPQPVEQLHARPYDKAALAAWLKTQGFRSISTRLGLDSEAPAPRPRWKPRRGSPREPGFGGAGFAGSGTAGDHRGHLGLRAVHDDHQRGCTAGFPGRKRDLRLHRHRHRDRRRGCDTRAIGRAVVRRRARTRGISATAA